ncbi:MAG: hypothetical protein R3F59_34075 [Myxococcota bacterium]
MIARAASVALALLIGCSGDKGKDSGDTGGDTTPTGAEPYAVLGDYNNLPSAALLSIWGTCDTDMFVVGADDGSGPVVLHYDGTGWRRIQTGSTGDLWWVWSDGGDLVWFSGEAGRVLTYSRSADAVTSEEVVTDPAMKMFGLWGSGPTDIWTVGGDIQGNQDGVIVHYDGTQWTEAHRVSKDPTDNLTTRQAFKVWGAAANDVWVVGTNALISHWDGSVWTDQPQSVYHTAPLFTVSGTGPNDVTAVGGGGNAQSAHFDGSSWTDVSPPPYDAVPSFNGVKAVSGVGTVACGFGGSIYWFDGTTWSADPRPRPTPLDFHACWIDDQGATWAIGGDLTNLSEGVIVYSGDRVQAVAL